MGLKLFYLLPTKAVRIVAKKVRKILDKTGATPLLVTATKGIEPGSKKLISDILTEEVYPNNSERIVAISGPSHAENVAQKDLTAIACASTSEEMLNEFKNYSQIITFASILMMT